MMILEPTVHRTVTPVASVLETAEAEGMSCFDLPTEAADPKNAARSLDTTNGT